MAKQGIEKIPLRIPEKWDAAWYIRHCREVLALMDTRNAIAGDGVVITGNSDVPATISASADVLALRNQPYILAEPSAFLPNERVLTGQPGFITAVDGGPEGPFTIGIDQGMNPRWTGQHVWEQPLYGPMGTADLPTFSADESRHAGLYFPDFNQVGISTDGVLRWDVDTARTYQTLPLIVRTGDGQSAFFQNATEPTAGVEVRTTYNALGTDIELSFWENNTGTNLDDRFRWFLDGAPANEAYYSLYRHDGSPTGNEILRFTRTTAGGDWLEQLRVADGSFSTPGLAWTAQPEIGFYRSSANFVELAVGTASGGFTVVGNISSAFARNRVRNNNGSGACAFQLANSSDALVGQFAYYPAGYSTGTITAPGVAFTSTLGFQFSPGSTNNPLWVMATTGNFTALDNIELRLGTGGDLRLFHNATNSIIRNDTGSLIFQRASGTESFRFGAAGQFGIGGATYGTANTQALVSGGASAAPSWQTVLVDGQTQTLGGAKTWSGQQTWNQGSITAPLIQSSANAMLFYDVTGAAADQRFTRVRTSGSGLRVDFLSTDTLTDRLVLYADRSGVAVTTMIYANSTDNPPHTFHGSMHYATGLQNYADDSAAAAGGIAVNQLYRNGSIVQIRVT